MLALAHDYRVMRTDKGVLYLSEVREGRTCCYCISFKIFSDSVKVELVSDHPGD